MAVSPRYICPMRSLYVGVHIWSEAKGRAHQSSEAVVGKTGGNSSHPPVHLTAVEEVGK